MKFSPKVLAGTALILAFLAMVVRNPRESGGISVDVRDLAAMIQEEQDHITADELATILMSGSGNIRLIDLRDSSAYAAGHIPAALRMDLADFVQTPVSKSDTVVLYSEGGIHAAQAWVLMRAQGYRNVFTLKGGLIEWNERVLFPSVASATSREERKRLEERAHFFGGRIFETKEKEPTLKSKKSPPPPIKTQKEQEKTREVC